MNEKMKRCTQCQQEYPETTEYFRVHCQRGTFYAACRKCQLEQCRKSRQRPEAKAREKEYMKEYNNRRNQTPEHKEYKRQHAKARREKIRREKPEKRVCDKQSYYLSHKDAVLEKAYERYRIPEVRERILETARIKRQEDPEKFRLYAAKQKKTRKERKANLPNDYTADDWQRAQEYWGNRCAICGRIAKDGRIIVPDHWIPISDPRPDNPGTVPWNMLPMCHAKRAILSDEPCCNNSKLASDPASWLKRKFGEEEASSINTEIQQFFDQMKREYNTRIRTREAVQP